ncbi:MAG: hypothetical protein ACXWF8_02410 [Methylobacter sp.]
MSSKLAYALISGKIRQRLIFTALLLCCLPVFADDSWSYRQETDRLNNRTYSYASSSLPPRGLYDNIRLQIACKDNVLQAVVDADSLIASQGSAFDVEYQIDKNPVVKLRMQTFKDTKRKGYTTENASRIIDDILSGQSIFIRINTMIRKVLSAAIPLETASEPVKRVAADCGLGLSGGSTAASGYSLSQFEQDFAKLAPAQQRQALDKIKQIIDVIGK